MRTLRLRCSNPTCRNFKYAFNIDFCPECRGQIALRYSNIKKRRTQPLYTIRMVVKPNEHRNDHIRLVKMYDNSEPIIDTKDFLKKISIEYINAYFGYSSRKTKRNKFQDDETISLFKSKYNGSNVLWMEKDDIHYIFFESESYKPNHRK